MGTISIYTLFPRRRTAQIYANGSRTPKLPAPPSRFDSREIALLGETTRDDDEGRFA